MDVEEWLGAENQLGIDIWNKKYCYNGETFDHWLDRVSAGDDDIKRMILEKTEIWTKPSVRTEYRAPER